jgi:hypothetical protein
MKRILIIILIQIALSACASTQIQSEGGKITKEQIEGIRPGVTAKNIVIETFGNPAKTEIKPDGTETITYIYSEKSTPTYFGGFIVNERNTQVMKTTLEVVIKDGLVLSYSYKKEEEK